MKPRQYFPLGKAYGRAFCNRVEEAKALIGNIENGKHTFMIAPRRYGKSSLSERALEQVDMAWSKLDFHVAVSAQDVERIIVNGVIDLIGKSIGSIEKLVHIIKKYAKKLKPKLGIGKEHFRLEFEMSAGSSPAENIAEAFLLLEKLLQEKNKQAVMLLDEFQEISVLEQGKSIEGAIRHAAQETKYLSLIFSGSNPHLMKSMFENERRPLYKLCRKLVLERISEKHYQKHLNIAAKAQWKKLLPEDVFEEIMRATERHPYYVNYLCDEIWSEYEVLPNTDNVQAAWQKVVEEERSDLLKDFFSLSENQRKIMIHIANHGGRNIYSTDAAKKMDIAASSVSRALTTLMEKDFIEKSHEDYNLIVPVYKTLLEVKEWGQG